MTFLLQEVAELGGDIAVLRNEQNLVSFLSYNGLLFRVSTFLQLKNDRNLQFSELTQNVNSRYSKHYEDFKTTVRAEMRKMVEEYIAQVINNIL